MDLRYYPGKDWLQFLLLMLLALLLYYPVFYSDYLYTDEAVQLWWYRPGEGYSMFTVQGRYVTDLLMSRLFGSISTISEVKYLRIFSFTGWLLMLPVWFIIFKTVFRREGLPARLVPVIMVLLVASPTVTISIGWASCLELFIAYTAGLISGYAAYRMFTDRNRSGKKTALLFVASMLFALLSLFTYQNGIGCFLLPFFIHCIANKGRYHIVYKGIFLMLAFCVIYYVLFRWQMLALDNAPDRGRTALGFGFVKKIRFFFTKALTNAFHFGYLVTESSRTGMLVSTILFAITALFYTRNKTIGSRTAAREASVDRSAIVNDGSARAHSWKANAKQLVAIVLLLVLTYLPSMAVRENYASNRTLLALVLAVSCWALVTFYAEFGSATAAKAFCLVVMLLASINAFYNYNYQFRRPLQDEYCAVKHSLNSPLFDDDNDCYVLRPPENLFVRKYGVTRSWDEFGVPSNFFGWVPELVIRQIRFEMGKGRNHGNFYQSSLPGDEYSVNQKEELLTAIRTATEPLPLCWIDSSDNNKQWILFEQ